MFKRLGLENKKSHLWVLISTIIVAGFLFSSNTAFASSPSVVATIPVGNQPWGVAYDSAKGEIFVANYNDNTVSVISDSTNTVVATIHVGASPFGVAYDPAKGEIFVTNYNGNTVSVISDSTNTVVATLSVSPAFGPSGAVYDQTRDEVFVADVSGALSIISDSTSTIVTIPFGGNPIGVAYDSAKGEIFVANGYGVLVVSDSTNALVGAVPSVGSFSTGVAYDSARGEVFVTNPGFTTISVISDITNTIVATVPVGSNPTGVTYDSAKGEIFVANKNSNTVSVISDSTNTVVATIPVGHNPYGIAYDSAKGEVFVTNSGSKTVSVISDGGENKAILSDNKDSFVQRLAANSNEGKSPNLPVMDGTNRALIGFQETDIVQAATGKTLQNAKLRLFITNNGNNWGTNGRTIEAHKLLDDWTEGNGWNLGNNIRGTGSGVTWKCAIDGNVTNFKPDCVTKWNGGNFDPSISSSLLVNNTSSGWIEFDVTPDVNAFLLGTATNHGWIIKKTDETTLGLVIFASREAASNQPQLVLTFGP